MIARLLALVPLLAAAAALGLTAAGTLGLVLAACLVLTAAVGPRLVVDTGRQLLSSAIGAGAGYVLTALLYEPEPARLRDGWAKLSAAALLAAGARLILAAPRGGQRLTLALGYLALLFAGKVQHGAYPACAIAFLLGAAWALPSPGSRGAGPPTRRLLGGAGVLLLAGVLAAASTAGVSQLHAWARARTRHSTSLWQPRTGFSDRMDLGALSGLLDSDRRVLRVRGPRVDYLRGAALDVYENGRWLRSRSAERETSARLDGAATGERVEISTLAGRQPRFFLPLSARLLQASPATVAIDDLGNVRPEPARADARTLRFSIGRRDRALVAEPRASDLVLPRRLRRRLGVLARSWTRGAQSPAAALAALEHRLRTDYGYARELTRPLNADPVLDFLYRNKVGHCEYFASALALLARATGIPARVVTGYRVSERSPLGHFVVRERNAHAWVEAWLPGEGWSTRDATPAAAQPHNQAFEAGWSASALDALDVTYEQASDWLSRRTLRETSVAWLAGGLVLAFIVARGARRRAQQRALADDEVLLAFMRPLVAQLERRGHTRRPDEPLERLAERVPDDASSQLIRRYGALRYGGQGDRERLAREVAAQVAALTRRARDG